MLPENGEITVGARRHRSTRAGSSLDLLEAAFLDAPVVLALIDRQGRFRRLNNRFALLLGYGDEDLVGWTLEAVAHPEAVGEQLDLVDRMLTGERFGALQATRWLRRDGSVAWVTLEFNGIRGPDGKPSGLFLQVDGLEGRALEEDRYRLLANNISDVVGLYGPDGICEYISPSVERVLGFRPAEMIGRPATHLPPPPETDPGGREGAMATRLVPMRRKDGRQIVMEISTRRTESADGRPLTVAVSRDVTERVERDRRFHLMAENTSDIIMTTSVKGELRFISPSCKAVTGRTPEQFMSETPRDFVHPDDLSAVRAAYVRVRGGAESVSVRWRGRHRNGQDWIWLESRPTLLRDTLLGREPEILDVIRDVGEQVAQEAALAEARAVAEAAASAKADFLANMSHELRTPLTAVLGFSDLLVRREDLSADARHLADRIATASRGLLTIVNDVLDLSKVEAGHVEIRPRPTATVQHAREVIELFQQQAEAKGLSLALDSSISPDELALLDPERTRQVLVNLVGNAVKFTQAGEVRLVVERRGDELVYEVSDTGEGLSREQCERLFRRFSQVDNSATRRGGGTGLGLAICRGLVEAMGGTIGVRSTPGAGSCFHVHITAALAAEDLKVEAGAEETLELAGLRVLVADDNAMNRELVRLVLEPFGVVVVEACDGTEAVRRAGADAFDVILMDVCMPGHDGREAAARIRNLPGPNRDAAILAFSAATELAAAAGPDFDGALAKPVEVRLLLSAMAEHGCARPEQRSASVGLAPRDGTAPDRRVPGRRPDQNFGSR